MKTLALFAAVVLFAGIACAQEAGGTFAPLLKKVSIGGKVVYEYDKTSNQTIELSADQPVDLEYLFLNNGGKGSGTPAMVFVHFDDDKDIAMGADFTPAVATTAWKKGEEYKHSHKVGFGKFKGQSIRMFVGFYLPKEEGVRVKMENADLGGDDRVLVCTITVK